MTDDNSNKPVDITDNLDEFEAEFFGKETPEEEVEIEEDVDDEDNSLANEDDEPEDLDDESDETDEDEEDEPEEDEDEKPAPKGKRNRKSARERIEELYSDNKHLERELASLRRELEKSKAQPEVKAQEDEPKPLREQLSADAPNPDALDKDGNPIYPLGEFDPTFIRDLTKFTIEQETKAAKVEQAKAEQQQMVEAAQEAIKQTWTTNLQQAEEEMPDIREKILDLTDTFQDIEPVYGEYLASTIMASEAGPKIMYYLSQNIGEAQKIVASGPAAATLAIGRLEAKLSTTRDEPKRNKRVSDAPAPPVARNKGNRGQFAVRPDTDDLDAFEREFFKKKK